MQTLPYLISRLGSSGSYCSKVAQRTPGAEALWLACHSQGYRIYAAKRTALRYPSIAQSSAPQANGERWPAQLARRTEAIDCPGRLGGRIVPALCASPMRNRAGDDIMDPANGFPGQKGALPSGIQPFIELYHFAGGSLAHQSG